MARLVKDAAKIDKSIDKNSLSYANIVQAIHVVQSEMGIAGTTAKEAEGTITGSLASVKGAWNNLLTAVASGDDIDGYIEDMTAQLEVFIGNMMPVAERALQGFGRVVEKLAPIIEEKLPALVNQLTPPLIKAATSLVKALIVALPDIVKALIKEIPNILKGVGEAISEAFGVEFGFLNKIGDFFEKNGAKIEKFTPIIIGLVGAFMLFKKLKGVGSIFSGLFGKGGSGGGSGEKSGGLFSGLANFAKEKPTVILKGMANLAIVLGGLTILSAVLMKVAPKMAKLADAKSLIEVISVIAVLGAIGIALAKYAGIVGKIPVSTVVKGLANMAIVIAGMSALFLVIGATSLLNFDYKRMLALVGILGVLGTVGATLAVFAGIAGVIPISLVLKGLANITLALGGLAAVVLAFGALAQIDGINEFISAGGELLANLFGTLGKIVGSIIGNLGEAMSEHLPAIGDNLAEFGTNIKPLFDMFTGVDMGGVGAFFGALALLFGASVGNDIWNGIKEFFGGENSFAKLGTNLADFGKNAKGFFTAVSEYPENGFTNASKLFESLSGMGSLPNTGGIGNWFGGEVDLSAIASGLKALSGEGTNKFLNMVANIAPETFDKVTQFFTSLSEMGGLPNTGGVAGWFAGGIDYAEIANGLTKLGGDGVKKFFTMAGSLDPQAFENTKLLFKSLAGMSESLPEKDSWWDKLWGNEKSSLSDVAADLGTFAQKSASFFSMINSLNLSNLNGLWNSLKNANGVTAGISKKIDEDIDEMVVKISQLPEKLGEAMKNSSKPLADSFVEVWTEAVKASVAPVNKLLSGANHILKEFGSKKTVIEWQPYANGTDGHRGGNALVNDGRGAELVQMPNGNTFIPQGRNVFLPNAPKGMKVMPAEQTARLMGRSAPTFRYADGIGDIDIWSYFDNSKGLVDALTKGISYDDMSGFASSLGQGMVSTFAGEMPAWVDKLFEECGQSISSYVASKGVAQWLPTVVRALKMEGLYSASNVTRTLFQMKTESGGNPHAINLWDSNAKKGIPSKGLMQVIDPTFNAYARSGFDKNIYDPLSNILASVRYATSRYGSLSKAYRGVGYSKGVGTVSMPSQSLNLSYTPESDGEYRSTTSVEYNTYAPVFEAHFHGVTDERTLRSNVKRWFAESFEEMVDEMDRSNPKTTEV